MIQHPAPFPPKVRKAIFATTVGSMLEWYEFTIFAQLSAVISKLFFPSANEIVALIQTFSVFALGFLIRPLGSLAFGHMGDKYGRKKGLMLAILLMAVPTAVMGLLPTYAQVGVWAPLALACCRLMQGLSLGGESGGAVTYAIEHAPAGYLHRISGVIQSSVCSGVLLGSLTTWVLSSRLSAQALEAWGWRVPFLLSIVLGAVGFFIRYNLDETPAYHHLASKGDIAPSPLKILLQHKGTALLAMVLFAPGVFSFFTFSVFMQSFMHKALGMSLAQVMRYNCGALLVAIAGSFVAGFIADKHQTRAPLILSLLAMVLLQYPMMVLLHQNQGYGPVVAQWVYGALAGAYCGALFPCLVELFPTAVRFTGVNFSMSLCSSLFGGTVPMVAFALVKRYSTPLGLFLFAGYTTVFCTISFCALWVFNQKRPLRATKAQPAQSCMQAAQGILQANAAAGTQDKNVLDPHTPAVL